MISFLAAGFALAGLVAATGPLLIHLLNRRRFRVLPWAAMDFLREAMRRSRRALQLRDMLLLILRMACVLLFGLALARPYFQRASGGQAMLMAGVAAAAAGAVGLALFAALTGKRLRRVVAAVGCLGLAALAAVGIFQLQKDWSAQGTGTRTSREPVHAVLLIDNSLSMGYTPLSSSMLDLAKAQAARFIDELPRGSRISVLPLCGPASTYSMEAYRTREDAHDAIKAIKLTDRQGSVEAAASLALEAIARVTEMPTARVVLISDQQRNRWSRTALEAVRGLPELQVVQVAPLEPPENAWVESLVLRDGLADAETEATLVATVRYLGPRPRQGVQVHLEVDGAQVAARTIDLQPGQAAEVTFTHKFDASPEPGKPAYALVQVSLPPDRLNEDNRRFLVVPVLSAVPVVFVDQYDPRSEDPSKGRYGETFQVRRLLAPVTSRASPEKQLVQVRHVALERLQRFAPPAADGGELREGQPAAPVGMLPVTQFPADGASHLDDVRLVVVAGVPRPDEGAVTLLREYVLQGGQLLIAAGADFDPAAWQELAWKDGAGILPLPLTGQTVGQTPAESTQQLQPFLLDFNSLRESAVFKLEGEDAQALQDLYGTPLFFKAVGVDASAAAIQKLLAAEQKRLAEERATLAEIEARRRSTAPLDPGVAAADALRLRTLRPDWLLWADEARQRGPAEGAGAARPNGAQSAPSPPAIAARAAAQPAPNDVPSPHVHARYTNGLPFLVERRMGDGRVMFVSSGLFSSPSGLGWNTLPVTDAMLVVDRLLRSMLQSTLPPTSAATVQRLTLAVPTALRRARFTVTRPSTNNPDRTAAEEPLYLETLGEDRFGVTISEPIHRGHYVLAARRGETAGTDSLLTTVWRASLAVNGPAEESDLSFLDGARFGQLVTQVDPDLADKLRWVGPGESIKLEGAAGAGWNVWWKILALAVLACLVLEMAVLARPVGRLGSAPAAP